MTRKPRLARITRKPPRRTRKAVKPTKRDPLDEFIAIGTRAHGLKIEKAWMPAVRDHLLVTLRHGALVSDFSLPDDAEPAPVFKA